MVTTMVDDTTPARARELDEALERRLHHLVAAGDAEGSRGAIAAAVREIDPLRPSAEVTRLVDRVLARVRGLGPLQPFLSDPTVSEVMVNGPGPVWVERHGELERTSVTIDAATLSQLLERVVAPLGRRLDHSSPFVDARLHDGSRVNAVLPPLAVDGPYLTIRRFLARVVDLDEVCPPGVAPLLRWAVTARLNVVVLGGAGAGKTTLLNALARALPDRERIVTVEDAAELRLPGEHIVRLESRPGNADGAGAVTIRDLVRNALRMRPDRIVVGECRGGEALDMVQAMTTGHEGSMSTCHASSPGDALRRLETMVLLGDVELPLPAVREQVASAVDLLVQVARRAGGQRRVVAVSQVVNSEGGWTLDPLADETGLCALPTEGPRDPLAPPPDPTWLAEEALPPVTAPPAANVTVFGASTCRPEGREP